MNRGFGLGGETLLYRRLPLVFAGLLILAALASCTSQTAPTPISTAGVSPAQPASPTPIPEKTRICLALDVHGIDDGSYNAASWKGVQDAVSQLGVEGRFLAAQQPEHYERNLIELREDGCGLIVAASPLLADAVRAQAQAHPEQLYAVVGGKVPELPNLRGADFAVQEAAFLSGYLAAGMTQTGIVGTYAGADPAAAAAYQNGFAAGVGYYNEVNQAAMQVLGWDMDTQQGLASGIGDEVQAGRTLGMGLMDQGADVIMPAEGGASAGTLAVMAERGEGMLVGIERDWSLLFPDRADYILASVLMYIDRFVYETSEMVVNDSFESGMYVGRLDNNGVGIQYGAAWERRIPAYLKAEIEELLERIIAGEIETLP
jgi:basic membrane protein A and related proteins